MTKFQLALWGLLATIILAACSTEKNTFIGRAYHGTTAHYNGYFNANDLLRDAMKTYQDNLKEDYFSVLPIRPLPTEEEVKNMYAPIDTAVAKCTKVITNHAMPGMDKPSKKKEEHNKWIDENWITIGRAHYIRRDYDAAMKDFSYVKKFFANDPSTYVAEVWIAKTNIQLKNFTEATFSLKNLDKAMEDKESGGKKKFKISLKKKKKKKDYEEEPPEFPKKLKSEVYITKAQLAEARGDKDEEVKDLEAALKLIKKKPEKSRIHFILGQLYEQKGDVTLASEHFDKSMSYTGNFPMYFNARLRRALNGGSTKVRQDLQKMARDPKNAEFKDQIYYTLAQIAQRDGDQPKAKVLYTQSAFFSTSNPRQKAMAYEKLGDMSFAEKNYVYAQKYYDSTVATMPETYPNGDGVRNKADKLKDLVVAVETAAYEDSILRVAELSPEDQLAMAKKAIKKMEAEEALRKKQEAEKAAMLQEIADKQESGNGEKYYWNNTKTRQAGFEEFKKIWGQRINEDNWRRSDKIVFATTDDQNPDTLQNQVTATVEVDSVTPELLLANIPSGDSSIAAHRHKMMSAYYDAGRLYQDQLHEDKLAEQQYQTVLDKPFTSDFQLMSAYQLYRMYGAEDPRAAKERDFILLNYPTSDYAGYLRDPDYFLKKKERDKYVEREYLTDLDRFERQLYYPVMLKANQVIETQKDNPLRPKYYLLKARAQAKLNEDKTLLIPTLDSLMIQYPGTPEAAKAADLKKIITEGYSTNTVADFTKKSIFKYEEDVPMQVIIFLEAKMNSSVEKNKVADFNKEYFGRERLNVLSTMIGDKNVIIVKEFPTEADAAAYRSAFKNTRKYLLDLQKANTTFISLENLKTLFQNPKFAEYQDFFDENY